MICSPPFSDSQRRRLSCRRAGFRLTWSWRRPLVWLLAPALLIPSGCRRSRPNPSPTIPSAPRLPTPATPPTKQPTTPAAPGAKEKPNEPAIGDETETPFKPRLIALPPPGGSLSTPTWSPAGDALVFCSFVEDADRQCAHASVHLYDCADPDKPLTTLLSRVAAPGVFHRFESPSWSPDGKHVAVTELVGPYASEGEVVGWLVPVGGGEPRKLPGDTEAIAWSPGGNMLARLRSDQSGELPRYFIDELPVRPGATSRTLVAPERFDFIDSLSWSPDGKRLALVASRDNAAVAATVSTEPAAEPEPPQVIASLGDRFSYGSPVVWDPTGKRLLLADNATLVFVDVATGKVTRQACPGEIVGYTSDGAVAAVLVDDRLEVVLEGDDKPQTILELEEVDEHPVQATFSPDLSQLAVAAEGKLWLCQFARG